MRHLSTFYEEFLISQSSALWCSDSDELLASCFRLWDLTRWDRDMCAGDPMSSLAILKILRRRYLECRWHNPCCVYNRWIRGNRVSLVWLRPKSCNRYRLVYLVFLGNRPIACWSAIFLDRLVVVEKAYEVDRWVVKWQLRRM